VAEVTCSVGRSISIHRPILMIADTRTPQYTPRLRHPERHLEIAAPFPRDTSGTDCRVQFVGAIVDGKRAAWFRGSGFVRRVIDVASVFL
jgi:hypothetical protein